MKAKQNRHIGAVMAVVLAGFLALLFCPGTKEICKEISDRHPFAMGWVKYAVLATSGEIISLRMAKGRWNLPECIVWRVVFWGIIGIANTYMMYLFSAGVKGLLENGMIPGGKNVFLTALFTSVSMNLAYGPVFMALHKCTDQWLIFRAKGETNVKLVQILQTVDWMGFFNFTLLKTIPFFWIPAHTITFMLPAEHQVTVAALLSIALGIILNLKKKQEPSPEEKNSYLGKGEKYYETAYDRE